MYILWVFMSVYVSVCKCMHVCLCVCVCIMCIYVYVCVSLSVPLYVCVLDLNVLLSTLERKRERSDFCCVFCKGYGSLGISMEGSHRVDLTCKQVDIHMHKNDYVLQYRPPEPGIYLLVIKYADDHITGRQTDRQTNRHTDRQLDAYSHSFIQTSIHCIVLDLSIYIA